MGTWCCSSRAGSSLLCARLSWDVSEDGGAGSAARERSPSTAAGSAILITAVTVGSSLSVLGSGGGSSSSGVLAEEGAEDGALLPGLDEELLLLGGRGWRGSDACPRRTASCSPR